MTARALRRDPKNEAYRGYRQLILAVVTFISVQLGAGLLSPSAQALNWRYAPASPPQPPPGVAPAPYPVPLGTVGQISFWSPNHGLLITGGTEPGGSVKAGLYAYDGVEWHQLSTVCGGAKGRIAWAGPDEFWAIADQRAGQIEGRSEGGLESISLCHFLDGRVVGSYAMPLGQPGSYLTMDAAGCISASDCWFAGEDGRAPNVGSFHLHWDGSAVTAIYDPEDHAVTGMANYEGKLYEGLAIGPEDSYPPEESRTDPPVIRTIAPAGETPCEPSNPFCNVDVFSKVPLPLYPRGAQPDVLGGFDVASNGSALGEGANQLWAAANPVGSEEDNAHAAVTVLHEEGGEETWTQVLPRVEGQADGSTPLGPAEYLSGSETDESTSQATTVGNSIAPEPTTSNVWLSLRGGPDGESAHVARLTAGGTIEHEEDLPNPELDPVGPRGPAGPIACAAASDCWMATSLGWLFHLGGQHERDEDPFFSQLISERPPDASVPVIYPDIPPVEEQVSQQPTETKTRSSPPTSSSKRAKAKLLVLHIKSRWLHGRILEVSFTLTARAHVQLIGRRKGKVVAETRLESLRSGKHRLTLTLDPARWPSKLQFEAKPVGVPAPSSAPAAGTGEEGSNTTHPTSSDTVST